MTVVARATPCSARWVMVLLVAGAFAATGAAYGANTGRGSAAPPLRLSLVATLPQAIYGTSAPGDDRLVVVTRTGLVERVERSRELGPPILDLRGRVSLQGERGLLSIAFDPDYQQNHYLYAAYTDPRGALTVSRFSVADGAVPLSSEVRLLRVRRPVDHPYHNGGQLQFGPDGRLYLSSGDGGYVTGKRARRACYPAIRRGRRITICTQTGIDVGHAQDLGTLFGKILRLGSTAAERRPMVVAYGLRNPWRFSFDRTTGALYIGDVGWDTFEEVDYASQLDRRPLNFGWSFYEGRVRQRYGTTRLNRTGRLVSPLHVYNHNGSDCSIVGGYVYRGTTVRRLIGRYVFGDYCSGRIWSLRVSGNRAVAVRTEPIKVRQLDSFAEDAHGEIYAIALAGKVYRITE
jgi:glucose/arabinose dehydrogenase